MSSIHPLTQIHEIRLTIKVLGISQKHIAQAIGADQSQVSRVLSGKSIKASKVFKAVCEYVNSMHSPSTPLSSTLHGELIAAVASVWDGTEAHAAALSSVIRSLGALTGTPDGRSKK